MTTSVSADIAVSIGALSVPTIDLESSGSRLASIIRNSFTSGTGAGQVNQMWSDTRTLTTGATESLDLNGVLTDVYGGSIALTKLKMLCIHAYAANTTALTVGNVTNGIVGFFGAASHSILLNPDSIFLITSPDAGGFGITAATADLLKVANGSGASATYDIFVLGA